MQRQLRHRVTAVAVAVSDRPDSVPGEMRAATTWSPNPANSPAPRLIPATQWPAVHDWPPLGGLRHLIFHSATNGFDSVVRRCGRRVLIDEAAFFRWVGSTGEQGK